jgi:hypothetical protein
MEIAKTWREPRDEGRGMKGEKTRDEGRRARDEGRGTGKTINRDNLETGARLFFALISIMKILDPG